MSARQIGAADRTGFDELEVGRLTWIGLVVAGLGWALMIGEATIADVLPGHVGRASSELHGDLFDIAECVIGSGFGLAIIGALHNGFGTLNRFFAAVLTRSSQRTSPAPTPAAASTATRSQDRRPHRTLADGSVEVETILGTRRFASMREAREFI